MSNGLLDAYRHNSWATASMLEFCKGLSGEQLGATAEGTYGPVNVDLKAQGSVDLRLLESFVPQLERTGGRIDFTSLVSGTVKAPALVGSADGLGIFESMLARVAA